MRFRFAMAGGLSLASAVGLALACNSSSPASSQGSAYCTTEFATLQKCGVLNVAPDCLSALESECSQALESSPLFSAAGLQAETTCSAQVTDCSCYTSGCSDAGAAQAQAAEACIVAQLSAVHPSDAVQKLQKDFCAACPDGASKALPTSCSSLDSGPDGGAGEGIVFRAFSDTVVLQIDEQCTGASLVAFDAGAATYDCYESFVKCFGDVETEEGTALGNAFKADAAPAACQGDAFAGPG